jgi:ribosome modulation factor
MSTEEKEGYDAYWKGQSKDANPYHWSNQTWWMVEAWEKGWKQAEDEDFDCD